MPDSIRVLCLGFGRSELRMMQLALEAAAHTLPRGFRITKADEPADVAVVNWSTLNIERTQAFLAQRFPDVPLISVSETGVLGAPGFCISEDMVLQAMPALVYEAMEGLEPASRARPPEYVSWLSLRRSWVPEAVRRGPDSTRTLDMPEHRVDGFEIHRPETPVAKPLPASKAATSEPKSRETLPFQPLGQMNVLVVAPDIVAVQPDMAMLRSFGAEVRWTRDEREVVDLYARAAVDLVLIDARWPEERGYRICRTLAHHPAKSHVPIIMVAADLRPIERARSAYAGSQGLMRWPITEQQVIERVPPAVAYRKPVPAR